MIFNADDLSQQERYKLAIGSVVPRPIALVSTVNETGSFNVAPFSFFNVVCVNPLILGIFVQRSPQKGGLKDTAANILRTKEFVIGTVQESNVPKVNITSGIYPYGDDEFVRSGLTPRPAQSVKAPIVAECDISFECQLEKSEHFGDELSGSDAFFGRVVHIHIQDGLVNNFRIDLQKLAPVSRLAGNFYAKVGEIFEMERP